MFLFAVMSFVLSGGAVTMCGCAALWVTGAVAAGATAYDVATHRECPNCKKVIKRDLKVCPYCNKELAMQTEKAKQ